MQNQDVLALFMVKEARYLISHGEGEPLTLVINYYHNRYRLLVGKKRVSCELREKADKIAKVLLKRKHRVNYAYKFRDL